MSDLIQDIIVKLSDQLSKELDNLLIEGLKRRGYEFDCKEKLREFISNKCRCEDNVDKKERIYFVNDTPFFIHNYAEMYNPVCFYEGFKHGISATYGFYSFL